MERETDYKGMSWWLIILGALLGGMALWVGGLWGLGAVVCFVVAVLCHQTHVEQQLTEELRVVREKLKAIENRLPQDSSGDSEDVAGSDS